MSKGKMGLTQSLAENEASILAAYLISKRIGKEEIARYERAIEIKKIFLSSSEQRLWNLMLRHRSILASVDSGLALINSNSPLRQRIAMMLAILEAHPDHISSFYIQRPDIFTHISLLLTLFMAPFKAILGIIIIKIIK